MAKHWLTLERDLKLRKLLKLSVMRLGIESSRGILWLVRATAQGAPELLKEGVSLIELASLLVVKVAPKVKTRIEKLQNGIDQVFFRIDRILKDLSKTIAAVPVGGYYFDLDDQTEPSLTQSTQPEAIDYQLPTEDIPKAIALYDGSVLLACRSGAGKTTTILSAIAHAGDADIWIFDGKGSAWGGRERNPERYFLCNHPDLIPSALEAAKHLVGVEMKNRQDARRANGGTHPTQPRRIIVIWDEFNNIVTFAQMVRLADELCNQVTLLVNMGREDLINDWIVAQTHLVGEINLSTGVQKSLAFVCQGRDTQYQSIEGALMDRNIISNPDERKRLQTQLAHYAQFSPDQSQPICFTTIGGKRLVKLPRRDGGHQPSPSVIQPVVYNPNSLTGTYYANSNGLPKISPEATVSQGFQPLEGLQTGVIDPLETLENQGFQPSKGSTWESQWEAKFWEVWQAIQDGKSNYWIGGNIFGVNGGTSYQRLSERLDDVRERLNL
jgi:hypothetical protein